MELKIIIKFILTYPMIPSLEFEIREEREVNIEEQNS